MSAVELLDRLSGQDIYLWAEDGKLRFRAAPGALTAELREEIKAHRDALLRHLAGEAPSTGARSRIVPAPRDLAEPFPLTEVQQAYWLGSRPTFPLSTSGQLYLEIDTPPLEPERLEAAWQRLVAVHPMLRAVAPGDGQQRILEDVPPYAMAITDLRQTSQLRVNERLDALRREVTGYDLTLDAWPLFDLRLSRAVGFDRVHLAISLLICDAISWRILLAQMTRLYFDLEAPLPELELSFRDYVLARQEAQKEDSPAFEYWRARLPTLPPAPPLPLAKEPAAIEEPRFVRREASLDGDRWQRLQQHGRALGATPTAVLLTAYAVMLANWSGRRHFLLNLLFFNRLPWHPEVDQVVGNFSSTLLFEVDLRDVSTFADAVRQLARRLLQDLEHAEVSGVRLLRESRRRERLQAPVVMASTLDLGGVAAGRDREAADDGEELAIKVVFSSLKTPQVWLDHQVTERDGRLHFHWDAVSQLFARGELRRRFGQYFELLWQLSDEQETWDVELAELLPEWPNVEVEPAATVEEGEPGAIEKPRVPPRDALEERLVVLWKDVLGVAELGVRDEFFEVGGQSLLAVRLIGRVRRELGREVPLDLLFGGGTVERMADALRGETKAGE